MKRLVTKDQLISYMKELDTRCKKWTDDQFDRAINNGFAELCTVIQPFVSQVNVDLEDYYELGESTFDINLIGDSTSIYDLYLMKETTSEHIWKQDEEKTRDPYMIWKDAVNSDVVHVDLSKDLQRRTFERAVVKYFYVPTAEFTELYISSDVYVALEAAISSAAYSILHDVEKSGQMRTQFTRLGSAVIEPYPQDYLDPGKSSMFPPGV